MSREDKQRGECKVGYITNVYPAVSHSFIKREIQALEKLGLTVQRWSIRPCAPDLPDPDDQLEASRTHVLFARPVAIVFAAFLTVMVKPRAAWNALRASLVGRPAGMRQLIVRFAHFAQACYLVKDARDAGIVHLHAHFGTNPASVARLAFMLGGPPYSFTVHGPDEFDQPIVHNLQGKVLDSRFAVAISRYGRSQLMRWSRVEDWNKIEVVRCGLDAGFLNDPGEREAASGIPVFSCVARLAPQKGLPVLVEAAAMLKGEGLRFLIRIAGDGELRGILESEIRARGLEDCFDLLGWASSERVRDVIRGSKAFVLPSFAEGLPVVIMEALALRCPVIVTRIAGIPELVDAECGWVVDAGSPEQLAVAMKSAIVANPEDATQKGEVGRKRVLAAHDADKNAALLADLIRNGSGNAVL